MTTKTLPAQASVSTPSGWTVTVTHTPMTAWERWEMVWTVEVTGPPKDCGEFGTDAGAYYRYFVRTPTLADPDPLSALDEVATLCGQGFPGEIPSTCLQEMSDAIAGMWGE